MALLVNARHPKIHETVSVPTYEPQAVALPSNRVPLSIRETPNSKGTGMPIDPTAEPPSLSGQSSEHQIDGPTAHAMLLIDFEQAFVIHNAYQDSERDLYKLSLRILAFPIVVAGALISAKLISSVSQLGLVGRIPVVWISAIIAGILNTIVLRAYIVTDKVQTEAKHQVNRLRSLYLSAIRPTLPTGWQPVWGATNPYLETRRKLKAANLTAYILGILNAGYVAAGADRLLLYSEHASYHFAISIPLFVVYLALEMELTWTWLQSKGKRKNE